MKVLYLLSMSTLGIVAGMAFREKDYVYSIFSLMLAAIIAITFYYKESGKINND